MVNKLKNYMGLCLLLLIVTLASVGHVSALPIYNTTLQSVYGNASCGVCHIDPNGGGNRTTYGTLFESQADHITDPSAALMTIGAPVAPTESPTVTPTESPTTDSIPPTTVLSGATESGIFDNNVTINLTATDNPEGSGVGTTLYMVNGGEPVRYTAPFTVDIIGQDNITYWSIDNDGNVETQKMVNFTIATTMIPFEFTVVPKSITVGTEENALYNLQISNTGNFADTYDLMIDNPGNANVNIAVGNMAIDVLPLQSANIAMTVNSAVTGTYLVNVTATSRTNAINNIAVNTDTIVTASIGNGSISGMKFNDMNGNGEKNRRDTGIENWTIILKSSTGAIMSSMETDSDGDYTFSNLAAGNYAVEEVSQTGWKQTFPETGTYNVTLADGENVRHADFGNTQISVQPAINATRKIDMQSLSPGEATDITVSISSNTTQALALQEVIPEGWNLTRISDDADSFRDGSINEWIWINVTAGVDKTVVYKLTASTDANTGTFSINGTVTNADGVVTIVGGDDTISLDIVGYYTGLGNNPDKVETRDLLRAMEDWRRGIAPDGFASPITEQGILTLLNKWATG